MQAPHCCVKCGTPFVTSAPLDASRHCGICRRGLAGYERAWAFGEYEGALRQLIHLFKYQKIEPLKLPLGQFLDQAVPPEEHFDYLVPVPLHWRRLWLRGFNQSELLAQVLGKRRGIPVLRALRRWRAGRPQAELSDAERRHNVQGAFEVRRREEVSGRSLLLVDDVLTTGATSRACALALRQAGARRVCVAAVARRDRRRWSFVDPNRLSSRRSRFEELKDDQWVA